MYPAYQAPPPYGIPAEAANLEYSILSAILGGSPDSGSGGSPATAHAPQPVASTSYAPAQSSGLATTSWPAEPVAGQYPQGQAGAAQGYTGAGAPGYGEQQPPLAIEPSETTLPASSSGGVPPEYVAPSATTGFSAMYPPPSAGPGASAPYPELQYPADQPQAQAQGSQTSAYPPSSVQSPPSSFLSRPRRNPSSPTAARLVPNWAGSPMSATAPAEGAVQSVYKSVTKGYDYTQGYHFLMKHLSRRCVFFRFPASGVVRAMGLMVCGCVLESVCEPCSVVGAYVRAPDSVRPVNPRPHDTRPTHSTRRPSLGPRRHAGSTRTTSCGSCARSRSCGRRSSRCRCRCRRRTRCSWRSASSARSSSSTSSSRSRARRPSRGAARARSASSGPSSACSPAGSARSSSGGGSTSTRCVPAAAVPLGRAARRPSLA